MVDSPPARRTHPYLTATVVVLVLLSGYVGGYFWLGEPGAGPLIGLPTEIRFFPTETLATAYYPMGWIQSRVEGTAIHIIGPETDGELFVPPS
jgi:hypothetical protein